VVGDGGTGCVFGWTFWVILKLEVEAEMKSTRRELVRGEGAKFGIPKEAGKMGKDNSAIGLPRVVIGATRSGVRVRGALPSVSNTTRDSSSLVP
jgi:hypothetical protein